MGAAKRTRLRVPGLRRRVYMVLCDHSVAGVKTSQRDALELAKDRHEQASKPIKHFVVGPYVLAENATVLEVG